MKFKENINTAVFTTSFVIENKSPILKVFHFSDGSWQFSGAEENLLDADYKVVSLGEIIKIDLSLLQLAEMPLGSEAIRKDVNSPWRITVEN